MKERIIDAGLSFFRVTGLDRAASFVTRGQGAILMFHNVRPARPRAYAPNQPLEVTPEFLESTVELLRKLDYEIVAIGDLPAKIEQNGGNRFAVLTFDDGYRDNVDIAAPILRRYGAPYAIYVTPGFVERTARLWWLELESAIALLDRVEMKIAEDVFSAPAGTAEEKHSAYVAAYAFLRRHEEPAMLECVSKLVEQSGAEGSFSELCMTWDEIRAAITDPLCTIGAHTLTHARLTLHGEAAVRRELLESKLTIEREIARPVMHLAYPFGDSGSARQREFAIARECGYETALTTRPGVLFKAHRQHMMALPRLAVHGGWQDARSLESLLTGAPFALWNLGRRVNVS